MNVKLSHILLLCLLLRQTVLPAQAPRNFYMRFGGSGYDVGYDVKQTLDNGYIITGSTSSFGKGNTDLYLVKLDSVGNRKFEKTFGNYNNEVGKSVVQLADSSYVTVGYTNSIGFGGYDIFLVKADKAGNQLWQKTIGGSDWDFGYSLQSTFDGGFVIAGTTYSYGRGNADGYVVKTDVNGDVVWTKTYGGQQDDEFKSIVQTSDGGFALTGYTKSYNDVDSGDVWVFKLDVMGDSLWCKFYGGGREDFGNSIIQLQNTQVLIAGGTKSESINGAMETLLLAFDVANGAVMLHYADPSTKDEYYNHGIQGFNGTVVGCGQTDNNSGGTQFDCLVDMYTPSYGLLNFFSMGSPLDEVFYSIDRTKDKGYALVGKTTGYNALLEDAFFVKIDSMGNYGPNLSGIMQQSAYIHILKTYPNPSVDGFYLDYPDPKAGVGSSYLQLLDMKGSIVLRQELQAGSSTCYVNTGLLETGFYVCQVYNHDHHVAGQAKIAIIKQ